MADRPQYEDVTLYTLGMSRHGETVGQEADRLLRELGHEVLDEDLGDKATVTVTVSIERKTDDSVSYHPELKVKRPGVRRRATTGLTDGRGRIVQPAARTPELPFPRTARPAAGDTNAPKET